MARWGVARAVFAVTALVAFAGVLLNALVAYRNEGGAFDTGIERFLNAFAFFTIQSNILMGVSALLLAQELPPEGRRFGVLRLIALTAISVTGLVYHTVLASVVNPEGWAVIWDHLVHTVTPVLAVAGFLVFGPRRPFGYRDIPLAALFPLVWAIFTLARGELIDWYPYPFIDVIEHGYPRVLLNCFGVAALFTGVAAALVWVDGWIAKRGEVERAAAQLARAPGFREGCDWRRVGTNPSPTSAGSSLSHEACKRRATDGPCP